MIRILLLLASLAWPVTRTHQELIDLVGRKGDITHLYDLYTGQDTLGMRIAWVTPQQYGGVADAEQVADIAVTNGSDTLTSASNPWTSADVGKPILVNLAGASSVNIQGTIATYISAGRVEISVAAGRTASGLTSWWGTDNTTAFQAAGNASNGVYVPSGQYLIAGTVTWTAREINLMGAGRAATLLKVIGVGGASTFKGFACENVQLRAAGILFEGEGINSASTLTVSDYNWGITMGRSGGGITGGTRSVFEDCEFRFFYNPIQFRGVSYVNSIRGNYLQWNSVAVILSGGVNEDSQVHIDITGNTFAENTQDISLANCSNINIDNNSGENAVWPSGAAGNDGTDRFTIYAASTTREIKIAGNNWLKPLGIILSGSKSQVVGNFFRAHQKLWAIKQDDTAALEMIIADNDIDGLQNTLNDYSAVVGGIYSAGRAIVRGNTLSACGVGIKKRFRGGIISENTILDPYASQTGKTHTGSGRGVVLDSVRVGELRVAGNLVETRDGTIAPTYGVESLNGGIDFVADANKVTLTGATAPYLNTDGRMRVRTYGSGTPEGAIESAVGGEYMQTDGGAGTSGYRKESGTGNTGWVGK
jgi:hypothetical protein